MLINTEIPTFFLLDFDGTITTKDIAVEVLEKYADPEWIKYEEVPIEQMLPLEDRIKLQYGMIQSDQDGILNYIEDHYVLREGFETFFSTCKKYQFPVHIVTAGIDFVIKHILDLHDVKAPIIALKATASLNGMIIDIPNFKYPDSRDFKEDYITELRNNGDLNIIYVGDGNSDFNAVENADFIYCVSDSVLERYCIQKELNYRSFTSFLEIKRDIENSL